MSFTSEGKSKHQADSTMNETRVMEELSRPIIPTMAGVAAAEKTAKGAEPRLEVVRVDAFVEHRRTRVI
ncbi:hypothetical protein M422DRAFT_253099 [Sphaerobolus stellatus SS14]|uniref:Uncharacterized protein n=1 Tax=Sphaerobolus stellatus (strain SS14) TaxID=990650 RepID=A0A0C9UKD3_SPHS4|nr:hypothetical protein M422DRAFT_253099 [Sphaerobolus stellatus SS14]